ncbi:hypothetical protein JHK82_027489 [Glycine max]|uniref:Uncharacterized protein n=1 Tax=Glycine soja TaxID=3848 RepID=A0A0B2Q2C8_GLYSO|nr:hypothetical protein JHK87_027380 [Glycine soja]KAG5126654.1 hypothetical protein JHK82_027489 [Glycine max]KAH1137513.1 hypothetical protein GYH30_027492 [Glycine max]KHN13952.1 hypothetical protein glysoja_040876 [Glycine soja]
MEELKNTQFSGQDAVSDPGLLHKELVGEKTILISELYKAIDEKGNMDNFVDVLEQECRQRKLNLSDIFEQVTETGHTLLMWQQLRGEKRLGNVRGHTPLHVVLSSKNTTMVNLILSQYALVKSTHDDVMKDKKITIEKNELGDTPLHEAVHSGDLNVVEVILQRDKDMVHELNKSRCSPLFLAAASEKVEILNLPLQIPFPADQKLPRFFGNSPLHAAILKRNPGTPSLQIT